MIKKSVLIAIFMSLINLNALEVEPEVQGFYGGKFDGTAMKILFPFENQGCINLDTGKKFLKRYLWKKESQVNLHYIKKFLNFQI